MEKHPIPPLYNDKSKILILGSFPSVKSREDQFFYAHPQNRFWRTVSALLGVKKPETVEEKRAMLPNYGIALWDVIGSCEITGSSDSSIKNVVANDISEILSCADIRAIFVNGKTAARYYEKYIYPKVGIKMSVLPSSSPANAAYSEERLLEEWRVILDHLGI